MRVFRVVALCAAALTCVNTAAPYETALRASLDPVEIAANRGAAALWQLLNKLHTRASLVMVTAHPDDEDGAMLTYESRKVGARVSLLTLNRGEGGANVMSSDFWDALGLVRTQELLAADRYYGVDQYFTTVCDYGFSKTMAEALQKWGHDRVLGDVVRIVRTIRPLVVTSVFIGGPSDGHGNHQVAGLMAKEVFDAAANPARFPEQIRSGLRPWKPLKYYAHTPWLTENGPKLSAEVRVPVGDYDALLGESYLQISRLGLGMQKSQNDGGFIPRAGSQTSDYHRFASRVPVAANEADFFDGIDVSLAAIATLAGPEPPAFLTDGLREMNSTVETAMRGFSAVHPESIAPELARGLKLTEDLEKQVQESTLGDTAKYDIEHEIAIKRVQFNDALVNSLGLAMRANVAGSQAQNPQYEAFVGDPNTFRMATPGETFGVRVTFANQSSEDVELSGVRLEGSSPDAWEITGREHMARKLSRGESADVHFTVKASAQVPLTRPYFRRSSIEQPYYDLLDPKYFGMPTAPYPLSAWADVAYKNVVLHVGQVVQTSKRVTGLGVVYEPLAVAPAISLTVDPQAGIIPLQAKSFNVNVTLRSNFKTHASGTLELKLPAGWRSDPARMSFGLSSEGEEQTNTFKVFPQKLEKRTYEITAMAESGGKTYRDGYTNTQYPGLRPYFFYHDAIYKTTGVDVTVAPGLRLAYIAGSGDDVPASLENLGVHVTYLDTAALASGDLSLFDVIVLGVRTYAAREDLIAHNQRLLDYVKDGGVMIVQYNTPEFDRNFGPYPYRMGTDPEEITDESSKIQILDRTNPVFNWPNKITDFDFQGWVEERGSKFMTSWDPRYEPLLETHDPGQPPQRGGLLFARYGKGIYVYNAYAFYRQLPEGVPGAYRIFANLVSLPKNPGR